MQRNRLSGSLSNAFRIFSRSDRRSGASSEAASLRPLCRELFGLQNLNYKSHHFVADVQFENSGNFTAE